MTVEETVSKEQVIGVLQSIFDPEIPVNIWDLGLIYDLAQSDHGVQIKMTLTAMGCPVGPAIAGEIENKLAAIGVENVKVDFVWSPPWTPERLTPDGREQLQMMGYPV
ncbi:MAG TPA: iron-sulfur cluster assembly protein [bacterium]|jgi:metal-sulfur cluster biosynthetic enzyme|nr:iron-sulfur cluster assembly protein [bacterium]